MTGRHALRLYRHHRTDIKLFLGFVLVAMLFVQWHGYNDTTRLATSKSIADDGDFAIDEYRSTTGDRIYYDGHFYSDKPPLTAFVGAPAYVVADAVFPDRPTEYITVGGDQVGNDIRSPLRSTPRGTAAQVLFILLTGVIPGGLLIVAIRKLVSREHSSRTAVMTAAIFGGGTLLFHYSTLGVGTVLAALFGFLSLYYAMSDRRRAGLLSGLFGGLCVSTAFYAGVIPAVLFGYYLWRRDTDTLPSYVLGGVIGGLPLLLYSAVIAGPDIQFLYNLMFTTFEMRSARPVPGSIVPVSMTAGRVLASFLTTIPKLLIYPAAGLFFYSPILVLALAGPRLDPDRGPFTTWIPLAVLVLAVLGNALMGWWWAGSSYGPRYLVPVIPALALPFAASLENGGRYVTAAAAALFPASVFQNLVGTNGGLAQHGGPLAQQFGIASGHLLTSPLFKHVTVTPGLVARSLTPHSLPLYLAHVDRLLQQGPTAHLLTDVLAGQPIDIRIAAVAHTYDVLLLGVGRDVVSYGTAWAVLPVTVGILLAIWHRQVAAVFRSRRWRRSAAIALLAGAALAAPAAVSHVHETGHGFYSEEVQGNWMEGRGVVGVAGPGDIVRLNVTPHTAEQGARTLTATLDGERVLRQRVSRQEAVWGTVETGAGLHRLHLESMEGCTRIQTVLGGPCRSFLVNDAAVLPLDQAYDRYGQETFGRRALAWTGFHPAETVQGTRLRWMRGRGLVSLPLDAGTYNVTMLFHGSRLVARNVSATVDGASLGAVTVPRGGRNATFPDTLHLDRDRLVSIRLDTTPDCQVPPTPDSRCLSIGLSRLYVTPVDDAPTYREP